MKCIFCHYHDTHVINSRATSHASLVWRRRKCLECERVFTTHEEALTKNLFVIKRNKKRVRFIYEKLFVSIFTSLYLGKYKDNGDTALLAKKLTEEVIVSLYVLKKDTITTEYIVITAYRILRKHSKHSADSYVFYSPYRQKIAKSVL